MTSHNYGILCSDRSWFLLPSRIYAVATVISLRPPGPQQHTLYSLQHFDMSTLLFDPLTTTTVELQQRLVSGKLSSVQIIETYLTQIDAHNPALNAFISLAPRDTLRSIAAALDAERAAGSLRGPFHGIPIVLKV